MCRSVDVTEPSQLQTAFDEIAAESGRPHILVNSAGALPDPGAIASASSETLQAAFAVNVFGALNAAQMFLRCAVQDPILLNINSGISHMAPLRSIGVYAASKAASAKLFDYLALENPPLHLVNVQPGVVNTEKNRDGKVETQDERESTPIALEGVLLTFCAAALPGCFCVWLAPPEAKFLRGKFVWVNWDVDELKERADEIKDSRLLTTLLDGVPM